MNTPNVTSNHHHNNKPIMTIGDVHDVFALVFGKNFSSDGNIGKAIAVASKATRKAVRELVKLQAAAPNGIFPMASFRQKWATLLGKEPMEFKEPGHGRGLQFEPEVTSIKRLFAELLASDHAKRWRECFEDAIATGQINDGKLIYQLQQEGMKVDSKIVALKPLVQAADMPVEQLEEALTKAS